MRIATLVTIIVFSWGNSACVTEGEVQMAPASDAEQANANLALGIGYLQEERPDLAVEALVRAVDADPRSADAHSVLAVAYDQTESFTLAEEHHRRAAQLAPRSFNTQNSIAVFLCRRNRWPEAEPFFDRAISVSEGPAATTAMKNAADCARGNGDLESAERFFRAVLDVNGRDAVALRGMMDVSIRSGNFSTGRAFWQRLESSVSVLPGDLLGCYVIEKGLQDDSAARNCADRLREEFPGSPEYARVRELERNAS